MYQYAHPNNLPSTELANLAHLHVEIAPTTLPNVLVAQAHPSYNQAIVLVAALMDTMETIHPDNVILAQVIAHHALVPLTAQLVPLLTYFKITLVFQDAQQVKF